MIRRAAGLLAFAASTHLEQLANALVGLYLAAHGLPAPRDGHRSLTTGLVVAVRLWLVAHWLAVRGVVDRRLARAQAALPRRSRPLT
jgi:hypothetical protein